MESGVKFEVGINLRSIFIRWMGSHFELVLFQNDEITVVALPKISLSFCVGPQLFWSHR